MITARQVQADPRNPEGIIPALKKAALVFTEAASQFYATVQSYNHTIIQLYNPVLFFNNFAGMQRHIRLVEDAVKINAFRFIGQINRHKG